MSAQQREAVAQYARLALRAIGDVEKRSAVGRMLAEREALLEAISARPAARARACADSYRVGKQDLRSVEQQQISLYATRVEPAARARASNSASGLHCIWRLGDGSRHFPLPEAGHCWGLVAWGGSPPGAPRPAVTFLAGTRKVTKRSAFESTSDLTEDPNRGPVLRCPLTAHQNSQHRSKFDRAARDACAFGDAG